MREITYREAINESLYYALANDPRVFLMGEDIGLYGGLFGVTAGLYERFGEQRVIDTPISEMLIAGGGVGAALAGMRPVVELLNVDFAPVAMDAIVNQAAKLRYMSGGKVKVPLVIRMSSGAGRGAAAQHSQSLHALFIHIPGLKVAIPSTPYDAKGLLNAAIEVEDPVLFIEHRMLYGVKGEVPEGYYQVPLGEAIVRRPGKDITVVATQSMVPKALKVAEELAGEGISIEVIDPRTIIPLDKETIIESVKKTGKLITFDEGCKNGNLGSEIAAIIAEEAVGHLQAPILRVAAPMTPIPYCPPLEKLYIPDEAQLKEAVQKVLQYSS